MFDHINTAIGTLIALAALGVAGFALRGQLRNDKAQRLEDQIDTQIKLARLAEFERQKRSPHESAPEGTPGND